MNKGAILWNKKKLKNKKGNNKRYNHQTRNKTNIIEETRNCFFEINKIEGYK